MALGTVLGRGAVHVRRGLFKGLGLLALVAPAALLLRRRENLRPWLLRACAALAAFVLLFIPWWVRNGLLTGEFVPFTANRGDIQLMGSYIGFGYPEGTYEEAVLQSDREAWEQGYQDDMERRFARRGEMGKERLWQWFTENPLAFGGQPPPLQAAGADGFPPAHGGPDVRQADGPCVVGLSGAGGHGGFCARAWAGVRGAGIMRRRSICWWPR